MRHGRQGQMDQVEYVFVKLKYATVARGKMIGTLFHNKKSIQEGMDQLLVMKMCLGCSNTYQCTFKDQYCKICLSIQGNSQ